MFLPLDSHPLAATMLAIALVVLATREAHAGAEGESSAIDLARCRSLAAEGRKAEAIEACLRASHGQASPEVGVALVRARMSGPRPPPAADVASAILVAQDLRSKFPMSPAGYAAMCDIAVRIGDDVMLQKCSSDLQRVAPDDPDTQRALAAARALRPGWGVWAGWCLIGTALLATLVDALRRALRRPLRRGHVVVASALALLGTLSAAHPASALTISKFQINDQDPSSSIPTEEERNKQPVEFGYWLMDLAEKATSAAKHGDHQSAIRYYTAMGKAVPDRPISFVHLCDEYDAAGDRDHAIAACGTALTLTPITADDYVHYLRLLVTKAGDLSPVEVVSMVGVVAHFKEDPAGAALADEWGCRVGLRTHNPAAVGLCYNVLASAPQDDPDRIVYQWTVALMAGNLDEARKAQALAKASKMPPEVIARLDRDTETVVAKHQRTLWIGVGATFLGFVSVLALLVWLRMRREEAPKGEATPPQEPEPVAEG